MKGYDAAAAKEYILSKLDKKPFRNACPAKLHRAPQAH